MAPPERARFTLMNTQDKRDQAMRKIMDAVFDIFAADVSVRKLCSEALKGAGFIENERERMLMNYFG